MVNTCTSNVDVQNVSTLGQHIILFIRDIVEYKVGIYLGKQ